MAKTQEVQKQMMMALKTREHARKDALSLLLLRPEGQGQGQAGGFDRGRRKTPSSSRRSSRSRKHWRAPPLWDIIEECEFKLKVPLRVRPQSMSEGGDPGGGGIGAVQPWH